MNELRPAVFLDRDQTINKWEHPEEPYTDADFYILSWDQFEFLPGVMEAMFRLYASQYEVFVISNQSGLARDLLLNGKPLVECDISFIFERMESYIIASINERLLCNAGVPGEPQLALAAGTATPRIDMKVPRAIRQSIFCPHHPKAGCSCRKPKPGMIYYLGYKYGIDLKRSWMIGDQESDMKTGFNAGIRRLIKIEAGTGPYLPGSQLRFWNKRSLSSRPVVPDLLNAVEYIEDLDKWEEEHGR